MISRRFKQKVRRVWSSNFAYAVGLLASDGSLNRDGRHIKFMSKDLELVLNFKQALNLTNRISRSGRGGEIIKRYYCIQFGDVIFYQFLNNLGLYPTKSKIIKAVSVPDDFFSDFLRGEFDGDGTFYTFWDKRWPNSFGYKMSYASVSLTFIQWLKQQLTRLYNTKGHIHKGAGVLNLEYTKGDTKKLFSVMYYKKDLLFLTRKYSKVRVALEQDKLFGLDYLQKPRNMPD